MQGQAPNTQAPNTQAPNTQEPGLAKPIWVEDKHFAVNDVIVVVRKSDHRRPRYSLEVSSKVNNEPRRHFTVRWQGQGRITIYSVFEDIARAVREAEDYVHAKIQADEDTWMEQREQRDLAQAKYGQPVTRHTGKTERKKLRHDKEGTNGGRR